MLSWSRGAPVEPRSVTVAVEDAPHATEDRVTADPRETEQPFERRGAAASDPDQEAEALRARECDHRSGNRARWAAVFQCVLFDYFHNLQWSIYICILVFLNRI